MPRITVSSPREFPNRKMLDFRGSPDQAEKLHPQNTIYVFHQATGGTIVMIDTGAPDPDPQPIYQEEPAPEVIKAPADPQPEPEPADTSPAKSLGSVLDNLQLKF